MLQGFFKFLRDGLLFKVAQIAKPVHDVKQKTFQDFTVMALATSPA
jgi:hypothetical protein